MTNGSSQRSGSPLVLIGYAGALAAPEVVWSLLEAEFRVVCFSNRETDPVLRHERNIIMESVPDVAEGVDSVTASLDALITKHEPSVVLPMDDVSLFLLGLTRTASALMPNSSKGTAAVPLDKRLQLKIAQQTGFRVPEYAVLSSVHDVREWSIFPAVLKPALVAREVNGKIGRSSVKHIATRDCLERVLAEIDWSEPWIIQRYITGVGEGVFGHMALDRLCNVSGHRRVRMMNPAGSGSSACISVVPDDATVGAASAMLREIDWRGMFMIELLRSDDGTVWFMELNGRAWGSMALARRQGFEYPAWTVRQQLNPLFEPPHVEAKPGLVCRHLGRDIVHLLFVLRGRRGAPKDIWPTRLRTICCVLLPDPRHALYNKRRGRLRLLVADTARTVRAQVRKRSA